MAPRTLEQIRASRPVIDRAKIDATTEDDIARHAREDDSETGSLDGFMRRRPGQRGPNKRPTKAQVTIRMEPATLDAWRASGPGWQTRLGEVLTREAPKTKGRA